MGVHKGMDKGEERVSERVLAEGQARTWQACCSVMQPLGMRKVGGRARAGETERARAREESERKRTRTRCEGKGEDKGGSLREAKGQRGAHVAGICL
jgi:hypothetical protein